MALLSTSSHASLAEKERQLTWLLVRQLADAQCSPGGVDRAERLWREVAALELDPERVIQLLYGGHDLGDPSVLMELDPEPSGCPAPRHRHGLPPLRRLLSGGGPRSAPPAALPAHPAGR